MSPRGRGRSPSEEPGLFDQPAEPRALTVSQLTESVRARVAELGRVRVEGELSRITRAASGHVYFDLKDEGARLSCAIWRSQVRRALSFELEEGMKICAHGRLDVYPPRGTYSLIVERVEELGIGALLARLEKLKAELRDLGWFDRARELPELPRPIGVVTSRDGAALRDFLRTRSLRWPGYPVRLCHTPVQGPGAAAQIAEAIDRIDRSGVDVIVVCRGGGSLEDLWAFNERPVAEAIWKSGVPVVSGIGHESDTTLADLVADHRAHTPTDAAQTVIPDRAELNERVRRWGNFLMEAMDGLVLRRAERLGELARRPVLRDGRRILGDRVRLLQAAGDGLRRAADAHLSRREGAVQALHLRLERQSPRARLHRWERRLDGSGERLLRRGAELIENARHRVALASGALEAISPLRVLARGYSLTRRRGETAPLREAAGLQVGEEIETRLEKGSVVSAVRSVE